MELKLNDKTYNVEYDYNCFCDTDILDDVARVLTSMSGEGVEDLQGLFGGSVKDMFKSTRTLLFLGLQNDHADEFVDEKSVGKFIEEYTKTENIGIKDMFGLVIAELTEKGFLSEILQSLTEALEEVEKANTKSKPIKKK